MGEGRGLAGYRIASTIRRLPADSRTALYGNRFLSQTGQGVFLAALLLRAGTGDSSAMGLSAVVLAMMIAAIVCGLPAGVLTDRLGPGRAVVVGATGRAVMIAALLVLPGGPVSLAVIAFGYSAMSQLFSPGELAMVATLDPSQPSRMHTILVALQHAGQGLGMFVLAPLTYLLGGPELMAASAFAIYAVVVGAAVFLSRKAAPAMPAAHAARSFTLTGTLGYFVHRPVAGYACVLLAFAELASKALVISVPAYLKDDLGLASAETLAVLIPAGLGAVLGLVWGAKYLRPSTAPSVLRYALLGAVVAVLALAGLSNAFAELARLSDAGALRLLHDSQHAGVAVAIPVALLLGACLALTPIAGRTVLSSTAPLGQQGRVFAMQGTLTDTLSIAPLVLFGLSAHVAGSRPTFLFIGLAGLAVFMLLEFATLRRPPARGLPRPAEQPL